MTLAGLTKLKKLCRHILIILMPVLLRSGKVVLCGIIGMQKWNMEICSFMIYTTKLKKSLRELILKLFMVMDI